MIVGGGENVGSGWVYVVVIVVEDIFVIEKNVEV